MHCKRKQGGSFGRNHPVCSKRVTQKLDDFSLYIRGFIVYGMTVLVVDITGADQLLNDFIRAFHLLSGLFYLQSPVRGIRFVPVTRTHQNSRELSPEYRNGSNPLHFRPFLEMGADSLHSPEKPRNTQSKKVSIQRHHILLTGQLQPGFPYPFHGFCWSAHGRT